MVTSARRSLARILAALAMAAAMGIGGPVATASAHAELLTSSVQDGASLAAPPGTVTLTFSDPLDPQFVRTRVRTPAGEAAGAVTTSGSGVAVTVPAAGPGSYVIIYRVVSADGHPVSGELHFGVAGTPTTSPSTSAASAPTGSSPPAASPAAASASAASPSGASSSGAGDGGDGAGGWLAGGIVLVAAVAVGGAVYLSRGRSSR